MTGVRVIDERSAPLLLTALFAGGNDPGPIAASYAQVPELCEVALPFFGASLGPGATGVRQKEIVILRTSALLECRYCVAAHTAVALDVGLAPAEVRALRGEDEIPAAFDDPAELALVDWIAHVALDRGPMAPGALAALGRHFEDHEIVELTNCIVVTMLLNRWCTALDLPIADSTRTRLADEGFVIR